MFRYAGNTFLTSKLHIFHKMEHTIVSEWTLFSSMARNYQVVNCPFATKVTPKLHASVLSHCNLTHLCDKAN